MLNLCEKCKDTTMCEIKKFFDDKKQTVTYCDKFNEEIAGSENRTDTMEAEQLKKY